MVGAMAFLVNGNGVKPLLISTSNFIYLPQKNRHTLSGMTVFSLCLQLNAIRFA